ncbi:2'-5' RNA ligase family protein [Radiobacillus deserti]|uniref:2'-5' RNA ligase family protein n=1 Tax=Radiobacillus deserti TaxID=2594883 RepID=UPI00131513A4|nr:2'-5' RNA ligase family protein [Radiobacillus deserti]
MITRSICVFPKFVNMNRIEKWREKYDTLFGKINPHVTLVFPFKSELDKESLETHVRDILDGVNPFIIELNGVSRTDDNLLYLTVGKGVEELVEIHDRLYSRVLQPFLRKDLPYNPHVTIGRLDSKQALEEAYRDVRSEFESTQTLVRELAVEIIEEDETSNIEFIINIGL